MRTSGVLITLHDDMMDTIILFFDKRYSDIYTAKSSLGGKRIQQV